MRRDKELKHVHSLAQVRLDRDLDRASRRVGHVAANTRQLLNLVDISPRTRLRHHIDRIVDAEFLLECFRDVIRRLAPDTYNGLITSIFIQ